MTTPDSTKDAPFDERLLREMFGDKAVKAVSNFEALIEALERILKTETMTTAVHAMDESYEIARQALKLAKEDK